MHERRPGLLANMTLQRYQEILNRSTGGEAINVTEVTLPAVARAYLARVYFQRHHPSMLGVRTSREMQTLATLIDYLCQNDPLRALDVAIQRQKALELQYIQGNWIQAQQLELLTLDEDRSYFKQELKAAQSEVKSEARLTRDSWMPRREWTRGRDYEKGPAVDADRPPRNDGSSEKEAPYKGKRGSKGKGKFRKGRGKRW